MSPLPAGLPVVDHHAHLSASGEGVAAARRFADLGGTHLFLTTQNYGPSVALTTADYAGQFEETERLARRVTADTGVVVYVVVAPYPVDLLRQAEQLGLPAAVELQRSGLELAGRWVVEQRAVALGEVGRCHFEVPPELRDAGETVFRSALEVARDAGCPAIVHCEELTAEGYQGLAALAASTSFPVGRLVKHYARGIVPAADRAGVVPSFVARREIVGKAWGEEGPWFLETDFLDDPKRPGAVLDLATVPRRARALLEKDPRASERLRIPFVDSVRSVYGFEPAVGS